MCRTILCSQHAKPVKWVRILKSTDNNSSNDSTSPRGFRYQRCEENKILQWIISNQRHSEVKGIAMWKTLECSNQVPGRSYQSMKERFRKRIAPNIQLYQLEPEEVEKFKLNIPVYHNRLKVKKEKINTC